MMQATQLVMAKLPCYEDLIATPASASSPAESGRQAAVWSRDAILATRVQLLMSALAACLPALPQVRSVPTLLLSALTGMSF